MDSLNPPLQMIQPNQAERAKLYASMNLAPNVFEKAPNQKDTEMMANLRKGAQAMQEVAENSDGIAAFYAWFEVAELWGRVNEYRSQISALEKAKTHSQGGITSWSVVTNMASAHAALGEKEQSIALFREYADQNEGMFVEYSLYNLALLFEESSDKEKANAALDELVELTLSPH